jgi:hypothetical protein
LLVPLLVAGSGRPRSEEPLCAASAASFIGGSMTHTPEDRNDLIGGRVIHALGKPGDLLKVQTWPLWENHYRVNVFVGADLASAKVANSFFLTADGDGNILESTPKITKQYPNLGKRVGDGDLSGPQVEVHID